MSHFDCSRFRDQCHGFCCGVCPVPLDTWRSFPRVQPPATALPDADGFVHQHAADGSCCYLLPDATCSIYPHPGQPDPRAPICAKFGDETHILMTCPYQDRHGRKRRPGERKAIQKEIARATKSALADLRRRTAQPKT